MSLLSGLYRAVKFFYGNDLKFWLRNADKEIVSSNNAAKTKGKTK